MKEFLIVYGSTCVLYSGYLMLTIYEPVIDELKYIITERYSENALKYTKRLSTLYAFIAFMMCIIFAPYLAYNIARFGHSNAMRSYKEILWKDIHGEVREGIKLANSSEQKD